MKFLEFFFKGCLQFVPAIRIIKLTNEALFNDRPAAYQFDANQFSVNNCNEFSHAKSTTITSPCRLSMVSAVRDVFEVARIADRKARACEPLSFQVQGEDSLRLLLDRVLGVFRREHISLSAGRAYQPHLNMIRSLEILRDLFTAWPELPLHALYFCMEYHYSITIRPNQTKLNRFIEMRYVRHEFEAGAFPNWAGQVNRKVTVRANGDGKFALDDVVEAPGF